MTKGDIERYRVEAAIAAMQAMIGNNSVLKLDQELSYRRDKYVARESVIFADALMAELGLGGD